MLVCNVSLRPPRSAITADVAEPTAAVDALATGNVVFATLVDDPASVGEIVDAYLGEIMLEPASASDTFDAAIPQTYTVAIAEAATASDLTSTVAGWTPASLTGLVGWWDASITASLSLTGSSVNSVADQSGGGNTMNFENGKPVYNATGFDSTKPAIVFSTVPSFQVLKATPFPLGTGNTLTLWLVTTMPASGTASYGRYFSYNPSAGGNDFNSVNTFLFAQNSSTANQVGLMRNSTMVASSSASAYPAPHRVIATISAAGAITIYIDGVSVGTGTMAGNWVNGGNLRIGNDPGLSSQLVAPIAEWGIATGFSDATTVGLLDTYLKTKWGL